MQLECELVWAAFHSDHVERRQHGLRLRRLPAVAHLRIRRSSSYAPRTRVSTALAIAAATLVVYSITASAITVSPASVVDTTTATSTSSIATTAYRLASE